MTKFLKNPSNFNFVDQFVEDVVIQDVLLGVLVCVFSLGCSFIFFALNPLKRSRLDFFFFFCAR